MKLIGAEIRVGYSNEQNLHEAKLIPLEIPFPVPYSSMGGNAVAEVTFHTTDGDVTVRAFLPNRGEYNPDMTKLRKVLEG